MEKILKCRLCGVETFLLIPVEVASDTFMPNPGVCVSCFKDGDINEKVFLHHKEFIQEQIDAADERKNYWISELKKLDF